MWALEVQPRPSHRHMEALKGKGAACCCSLPFQPSGTRGGHQGCVMPLPPPTPAT